MTVPFVDLKEQYLKIKPEIDQAIFSVLEDTAFINGKYVNEFCENFAQLYDVKHVLPVGNGTDAIYASLKMLGIGPGDEVITTACTWISTSETISQTGAMPVFVDINDKFLIDPAKIEAQITSKTKAIIPVHLYGQLCDMKQIKEICAKHKLFLLEDCAQAHFAANEGYVAGLSGDVGTFSFYPGKNLGAYGDAGCIITNDDVLAKKVKMFTNHGALVKHDHKIEGINSRMDGIQGAILNVKLKYIKEWTANRIENASIYRELLNNTPEVTLPKLNEGNSNHHVYHLFVIECEERENLISHLKNCNIQTSIHYPTPLPFMEAYNYKKQTQEDFPVSFEKHSRILSLPMFPELKKEQIEYVCTEIKNFYSK